MNPGGWVTRASFSFSFSLCFVVVVVVSFACILFLLIVLFCHPSLRLSLPQIRLIRVQAKLIFHFISLCFSATPLFLFFLFFSFLIFLPHSHFSLHHPPPSLPLYFFHISNPSPSLSPSPSPSPPHSVHIYEYTIASYHKKPPYLPAGLPGEGSSTCSSLFAIFH
ncbi:hypothetical protein K457DRAFT_1262548 [Linnemannia elongata AG-77]|uniref:Uncharacterized protein n=1 Tax=Linnemannia elongata AG-77 TaxID=1314771 RepID=A0A197K011_9FUNG|nr:hypothetical protein K457DRAFT_1262548 [Linnemannia elongata AG-77]